MRFQKTLTALLLTSVFCVGSALAQEWPQKGKTIKLILPYAPGGLTDPPLRPIAQRLAEIWGVPVILEHKPGAGTSVGTDFVAKSPPDGYTVLMTTSSLAINPGLYPKLPFDAQKDLAPVIHLGTLPNSLAVSTTIPVTTVRQFVDLVKANPGKYSYASSGNGVSNHLMMESFKTMTGIQINHAPHKGGGPAVSSLLGGHVQAMWNPPASFLQHVPGGKIKILAVATPKRIEGVDAPTLTESGYSGLDSGIWLGLFMPAGTPRPIVTKFNAAVHELLTKDKGIMDAYASLGIVTAAGSPEDLGNLVSTEIVRWSKVIKDSGAKLD